MGAGPSQRMFHSLVSQWDAGRVGRTSQRIRLAIANFTPNPALPTFNPHNKKTSASANWRRVAHIKAMIR